MSCLHWNNIIIHQYLESIDDMAFSSSFLHSSPKENVTVWRQRSLLFVCHPIARQSQVTMRRRSWSLATMETQLEMLGILYSVALRAENGVRSVIEFFKTFQRALQEISKPEPISECIRRIGGWCWDLSLKNNLNRPFTCRHFGSGICWFGCSVLSAMAWGIMGAQGAKKSDDVSGATESNLNLWSWSLRVTTMWMSTTTRHWDLLELFFFWKKVPKRMPKQQFKIWKGGSWRAKDQCGHPLQSFQRAKFAQLQSLAPLFWCKKWDMKWDMCMGNPGNQGDQGDHHFPDATLHSGPL